MYICNKMYSLSHVKGRLQIAAESAQFFPCPSHADIMTDARLPDIHISGISSFELFDRCCLNVKGGRQVVVSLCAIPGSATCIYSQTSCSVWKIIYIIDC